jgi:hypothetical protein
MATVINTNMASLFAQNSLANAQNNLATSVQRLSSGLRINSAKDDAAGLAISNQNHAVPSSRLVGLDLSEFIPSLYLIRIQGETVDQTLKIIKL